MRAIRSFDVRNQLAHVGFDLVHICQFNVPVLVVIRWTMYIMTLSVVALSAYIRLVGLCVVELLKKIKKILYCIIIFTGVYLALVCIPSKHVATTTLWLHSTIYAPNVL